MTAGVYLALKDLTRLRHGAHGLGFLPMQPTHSVLAGRKRARLRGRGLDFSELRRYRPGDDIRAMDWRVTRRTGNPHVRIYAEERDRPVWLLIDQRLSMFRRIAFKVLRQSSPQPSKSEIMITSPL